MMLFRTGTITGGQLVEDNTTNVFLNDGLDVGTTNITTPSRIVLRDFGTENDATVGTWAEESIDLASTAEVTIPLSEALGATSATAFTNAAGQGNPPHDVYVQLAGRTPTTVMRVVSVGTMTSTAVIVNPHQTYTIDDNGIFTRVTLTGRLKLSPMDAQLWTFSNANSVSRFNTREVHELNAFGTRSGNQIPNERQISLSVPSTYMFAPSGARELDTTRGGPLMPGRLEGGTTGNPVTATNSGVFLDFSEAVTTTIPGPFAISPSDTGYPYAEVDSVRGLQAGSTTVILSRVIGSTFAELFAPDNQGNQPNIYFSRARTRTMLSFGIGGGGFSSTTLVTQDAPELVNLPINSPAGDFLRELGRAIQGAFTSVTVGAVRVDGTRTVLDIDTNQQADVIPAFTISDTDQRDTDQDVPNPGGAVGTTYRLNYMGDAGDNRNFSFSQEFINMTTDELLTAIVAHVNNTAPGWNTIRATGSNTITFISRDNRPATATLEFSAVEPAAPQLRKH